MAINGLIIAGPIVRELTNELKWRFSFSDLKWYIYFLKDMFGRFKLKFKTCGVGEKLSNFSCLERYTCWDI